MQNNKTVLNSLLEVQTSSFQAGWFSSKDRRQGEE
jgi:hypothetical protein